MSTSSVNVIENGTTNKKLLVNKAMNKLDEIQNIQRLKSRQDKLEIELTMIFIDNALSQDDYYKYLQEMSVEILERIEHERHLNDCCANPICKNPPKASYNSNKETPYNINRSQLKVYKKFDNDCYCCSQCQQYQSYVKKFKIGKIYDKHDLLVNIQ